MNKKDYKVRNVLRKKYVPKLLAGALILGTMPFGQVAMAEETPVEVTQEENAGEEKPEEKPEENAGEEKPEEKPGENDGETSFEEEEEETGVITYDYVGTSDGEATFKLEAYDDVTLNAGEFFPMLEVFEGDGANVQIKGMPVGLHYNDQYGVLYGMPDLFEFDEGEEEKVFDLTLVDSKDAEKTLKLTIKKADVTRPAGVETALRNGHTKEGAEKSTIGDLENVEFIFGEDFEAVVLDVDGAKESVDFEGLPKGITYDEEKGALVAEKGLIIDDWAVGETERVYQALIFGTENVKSFLLTVTNPNPVTEEDQENTTEEETPDETPETPADDENNGPTVDYDGITDKEVGVARVIEISFSWQTVEEGEAIKPMKLAFDETGDAEPDYSAVLINGMPKGLTYSPETQEISGVPAVDDWGEEEDSRGFRFAITGTEGDTVYGYVEVKKADSTLVEEETPDDEKPGVVDEETPETPDDEKPGVVDEEEPVDDEKDDQKDEVKDDEKDDVKDEVKEDEKDEVQDDEKDDAKDEKDDKKEEEKKDEDKKAPVVDNKNDKKPNVKVTESDLDRVNGLGKGKEGKPQTNDPTAYVAGGTGLLSVIAGAFGLRKLRKKKED